MTRKLLLPTRVQRMRIRQQHVLPAEISTKPAVHPDTPDKKELEDQALLTGLGEAIMSHSSDAVFNHNRRLEQTENSARLERWIEEQKAHQQDETHQQNSKPAVSIVQALAAQSPPPPALPPRPGSLQTMMYGLQPQSQREGLLQQIREVGSKRLRQTSSADEQPPTPCSRTEQVEGVKRSTGSTAFGCSEIHSEPTLPAADNDQTTSLQRDEVTLPEWCQETRLEPAVEASGHPEAPTSPSMGRIVVKALKGGKSRPPIPPKPEAFCPESASESRRSLYLPYPYQTSPEATRHASTSSAMRVFTSNCGNFKVEAELLDWKDGKVWLRKINGVKIAVPLSRFSGYDVEFVVAETMSTLR